MASVSDFVAEGRLGSQVEADINEYARLLRGSLREWEASYDGSACVKDGFIYTLNSGADSTVDPSSLTGDWSKLSTSDDGSYEVGPYATILDSSTSTSIYIVNDQTSTNEYLNGAYFYADGSYHKFT